MCTYENINISTCAFVPRTTLIMAQDRVSSIFRHCHLQLVHATLSVITALELAGSGSHIYQIS